MRLLILLITLWTQVSFANTYCVAHRGNSSEHLENSMTSIISGYELGAHVIEFDVRHTKDQIGILMHDKTLKRTAQSKKGMNCSLAEDIDELTFVQIQNNCQLQNGEDVPTLAQVLEYLRDKDVQVFLELKDKPSVLTMERVFEAYQKNPEKLHIISFKAKYLKAVLKSPLKILVDAGVTLAHISTFSIGAIFDFDGVISRLPGLNFIKKALKLAKFSGAYTVNDVNKMKSYFQWHTDFIITNYPAECLQIKRGLAQL